MACYGEDTLGINIVLQWVRKSQDSGGNFVPNDWPRSASHVTTTHDLNRQNVDEFEKIDIL
jgi:4-alpha-glucanotransferase